MLENIRKAVEWLKNKFKKKSNVTVTVVAKDSVVVVAINQINR